MADGIVVDIIKAYVKNNKKDVIEFLKDHIGIHASFRSHGELNISLFFDDEQITSCYTYLPEELDSLANDRRKGNL